MRRDTIFSSLVASLAMMIRLALLILAVSVLGVSMSAVSGVLAQEQGIELVSEQVVTDFPDRVVFKLSASSPDPIDEIRVFLKTKATGRSVYGYLDLDPSQSVDGEYVMDLSAAASYRPPGTVIKYHYEIRDEAGRTFTSDEREHLYLDESLDWKSITNGILTIYYYGDFVERRAQTVLDAAQETLDNMGPILGIQPTEPIRIVSYSNYRDMVRALPFRSQAVSQELQTQGQAWSDERVVVLLSATETVTGIASHEFVHILVGEAAGQFGNAVPAWLNEGLAEYGNVDQTPEYDRALAYAVYTRRLKPLWHLQYLGGEPEDILIGYGHGKSVVSYLLARFGEEKMAELMGRFSEGDTADEALMAVYGFDQYGLDSEWRLAIGLDPLPSPEELEAMIESGGADPPASGDASGQEEIGPADDESTDEPADQPILSPATPEPTEAPAAEEPRRTSSGCGAPAGIGSSLPVDLVIVALMGSPLLAIRSGSGVRRLSRTLRSTLRLIRRGQR